MSQSIHRVKRIHFSGIRQCIVLQDRNGPCPLVALTNALLLRGALAPFPTDMEYVSSDWLCNVLAEYLFEKQVPSLRTQSTSVLDIEHNIADVVQLLPMLQHGMDVNVGFTDCNDYELTTETTLFDAFGVRLLHGWLADPTDKDAYPVLSQRRYNAATEVLIRASANLANESASGRLPAAQGHCTGPVSVTDSTTLSMSSVASIEAEGTSNPMWRSPSKSSETNLQRDDALSSVVLELAPDAAHIRRFLERTPTQLTYYGLIRLHETLHEEEYAVLFRNNHFATITKHNNALYVLVTDEGLALTPGVVWERLDDITSDTVFVDEKWRVSEPASVDELTKKSSMSVAPTGAGPRRASQPMPHQQVCERQAGEVKSLSRAPAELNWLDSARASAPRPPLVTSTSCGKASTRSRGRRPSRCGIQ
ncbi:hypothetical protein CCYA_CCYA07G2144 [Cyanidiococcus yangmingshanensis]|nr:hypothetical protein CCYA_CCYA07G2144 [Cyanidiococcus yangmingshanensis]